MIEAERRRADDECSARLHVESELAASKETVERLELLVKEYERYRAAVEQMQKTRTEQQRRDQDIQNTLNRSPTDQRR